MGNALPKRARLISHLKYATGETKLLGALEAPRICGEMRNMYVRLVIGQVKPGMMDSTVMKDVIKQWIEVNTAQRKMKGNQGAYLLVEHAANKMISISMWETAADVKATERAHRERASRWDHVLYTEQPITEQYEIMAQV